MLKKLIPIKMYHKLRLSKYFILRNLMKLFWIFPIDSQKVVFSNFNGKGFGDNPKYIAEALHEKKYGELYWLTIQEDLNMPAYIHQLPYGSIKSIYHLATARIWIDNNRKEPYIVKRKGQFYLQTWHGSIALKKIEKDAEISLDTFYLENAKRDSKMIDLMISNSKFSEKLFSKSFWYDGKIIKSGSPRLDVLFDKEQSTFRKRMKINKDDYVVLYAPTFRNTLSLESYTFDYVKIKEVFKSLTGKNVVLLQRLHPNLIKYLQFENDQTFVYDVSKYPDVYEIMKESDVLITDYSSLMFEFPVAEIKPVFIFATDIEAYDRGFYFNMSELPFPLAESESEIIDNILKFDKDIYSVKLLEFYKHVEMLEDGKASSRIADTIIDVLNIKENS